MGRGHGWSFALVYTSTALLGESSNELGLQATVVSDTQNLSPYPHRIHTVARLSSLFALPLW